MHFALYSHEEKRFITDSYSILINAEGKLESKEISQIKVLFKGLETRDIKSDLSMVCKVIRKGNIKMAKEKKGKPGVATSVFRRPLGMGTIPLGDDWWTMAMDGSVSMVIIT
jgi:hypothetical protein